MAIPQRPLYHFALWDFQDDFKHNDNVILTAFGAGFSWGATLLKWGTLRISVGPTQPSPEGRAFKNTWKSPLP
jgi:hypothetical protein